jgi:hypothetical protein
LRIANQAYDDVLVGYHPEARGKQLLETLGALCGEVGGHPLHLGNHQTTTTNETLEAPPDPSLSQLAWYTLRHRGIKTLVQQEWIFVRRMVAPWVPFRRGKSDQRHGGRI